MDHSAHGAAGGLPWSWLLVLAGAGSIIAAYYRAARRAERRTGRPWSPWRTTSLVTGVLAAGVALSPPMLASAHGDARGHMAQHLLFGMYAPLLVVLAAPVTALLGASSPGTGRRVGAVLASRPAHVLTHPVSALLLNAGGLYVLYLTPLYAATQEDPLLHAAVLIHLFAAGYLFAWSVAGPDPAPRRPGMRTRLAVLLIGAAAHSYLAKLLYAHSDRLPPGAHDGRELEEAAQWMYYGGDVAELLLAVALFVWWYRRAVPAAPLLGAGARDAPVR